MSRNTTPLDGRNHLRQPFIGAGRRLRGGFTAPEMTGQLRVSAYYPGVNLHRLYQIQPSPFGCVREFLRQNFYVQHPAVKWHRRIKVMHGTQVLGISFFLTGLTECLLSSGNSLSILASACGETEPDRPDPLIILHYDSPDIVATSLNSLLVTAQGFMRNTTPQARFRFGPASRHGTAEWCEKRAIFRPSVERKKRSGPVNRGPWPPGEPVGTSPAPASPGFIRRHGWAHFKGKYSPWTSTGGRWWRTQATGVSLRQE